MRHIDPGNIGGPVIIPNCVAVRFAWLLPDTRLAFNVLHASVLSAFVPTPAIAQAVFSALITSASWTTLATFLHTGTAFGSLDILDLRTAGNARVLCTGAGASGTSATLPLAPQTALVVTERTAFAGTQYRGRAYIPGWASFAATAGQVASAAAVAALQAWANTWLGAFSASGLTLAIGHKARQAYTGQTGTLHAARAAGTTPVTALSVRNGIWDSQRRRAGKS